MSRRSHPMRIALLTLVVLVFSTTVASAATGKVSATDVKFRREASTGSEIIDLLAKGTALEIVSKKGDWYKVRIGNINGYVYSDYVKVVAETPAPVASPVAAPVVKPVVPSAEKPVEAPVAASAATTVIPVAATSAAIAETPPVASSVTPAAAVATSAAASAEPAKNIVHVSANTLNIRETADADSKKLGELTRGDAVVLIETSGTWAKIQAGGGTIGYVLGTYLSSDAADASVSRGSDERLDELIRVAMSFKGVRYVYGAASRKGTDCSGFTMQVFKAIGISAPRSSVEYGSAGVKISREKLRAGDVVLFDTDGSKRTNISHVGIYLGNDKFIHASSTNHKVLVASFSGYQAKYLGARRFLN